MLLVNRIDMLTTAKKELICSKKPTLPVLFFSSKSEEKTVENKARTFTRGSPCETNKKAQQCG